MFSTSSPTYPASVRVVASAIANGTLSFFASVDASRVLPHPVGPITSMLLLSISTSDLSNVASVTSGMGELSVLSAHP